MSRWGYFDQRRRMAERARAGDGHRDWESVKAAQGEVRALRARVRLLEAAVRGHMADHDAQVPWRAPRAYDRVLWRAVVEDGLTDEERRYGGC